MVSKLVYFISVSLTITCNIHLYLHLYFTYNLMFISTYICTLQNTRISISLTSHHFWCYFSSPNTPFLKNYYFVFAFLPYFDKYAFYSSFSNGTPLQNCPFSIFLVYFPVYSNTKFMLSFPPHLWRLFDTIIGADLN